MESTSEDLTIAKIVSLPRLKVFDQELSEYEEVNQYENKYPIVDKNTYLGIEVEVENVSSYKRVSPYWQMIEDGSLRNHGREFITPPIRAWRVEHALQTLLKKEINPDVEFSERTSIHVHMNIRTLTIKQLEALVLTYIVFEKVIFNYIGEDRYNNIFCVPVVETDLGKGLLSLIRDKNPSLDWQKYTALNLLPIMHKGTIEFRHLGGTNNVERIITWINILLSFKKFALQKSPEYIWNRIQTLNTTSEYRIFGEEVFGNCIQLLWNDSYNSNVADCITYIKQFCLKNDFHSTLKESYMTQEITGVYHDDELFEEVDEIPTTIYRTPWVTTFPVPETWTTNPTIDINSLLAGLEGGQQGIQVPAIGQNPSEWPFQIATPGTRGEDGLRRAVLPTIRARQRREEI